MFFQTVLVIYLAHLGQDLCSQKPHSGSFACLASHPGLATCKGATFEVVKKGAKVILPNCACHLAQMGPDLYSKCTVETNKKWFEVVSSDNSSPSQQNCNNYNQGHPMDNCYSALLVQGYHMTPISAHKLFHAMHRRAKWFRKWEPQVCLPSHVGRGAMP